MKKCTFFCMFRYFLLSLRPILCIYVPAYAHVHADKNEIRTIDADLLNWKTNLINNIY